MSLPKTLEFMAVFNTVFWRIAEDSYPCLQGDDPNAYLGMYDAKDEYRRQLACCIEDTFETLNVTTPNEPEDMSDVYDLVDGLLPNLAKWITED